jgi:DNA repair protein RadA/Sms
VAAKSHSVFVCQQCGNRELKWAGRCSECGEWGSLVETLEQPAPKAAARGPRAVAGPTAVQRLADVSPESLARLPVPIGEVSRVLGGGLVPGSVNLIGGDPGIGKSTLLLQLAAAMAPGLGSVLYVSGEESTRQIKLRAERLGIQAGELLLLAETDLDAILNAIEQHRPGLVVVDSIQTTSTDALASAPGTVGQLRECAQQLIGLAKRTDIPVFLVGHVTKEGAIAGPRVLEHMVDAVLYLEGERFQSYRMLRAAKNRFGSVDEVGILEMREQGMAEVASPSEAFLAERSSHAPGSAVTVTMEGTRPLLVELQALVSASYLAMPRRSANGIELNRLNLLIAVLSKRLGLPLGSHDVYANVVGGLRISEPAVDLAVAMAIASSLRDQPLPDDLVMFGEVGLGGELRSVNHGDRRLKEAAALGFRRALVPGRNAGGGAGVSLELTGTRTLMESIERCL